MYPTLLRFELEGEKFIVPAYGTMLALALLIIVVGGWIATTRSGIPKRPAFIYVLAVGLSLPLGSRVLFWLLRAEAGPQVLFSTQVGNLLLPGGLLAALGTGLVVCRWLGLNPWRMADLMTPAIGLGGAVLRVGCFLAGCCFGRPAAWPWAVVFPFGSPAHLHQVSERPDLLFSGPLPVHPTQLYELCASLAVALIAVILLRRRAPHGVPMSAAAAWFLVFRWLNSGLRAGSPSPVWPSWIGSLAYLASIAALTAFLVCRVRAAIGNRERRF